MLPSIFWAYLGPYGTLDEACAARSEVVANVAPDAYVVVSWWQDRNGPPRSGSYSYEYCGDLNAASDLYTEYEQGEYQRATAIGIFPAKDGMPCGEKLSPVTVSRLVRETLAA